MAPDPKFGFPIEVVEKNDDEKTHRAAAAAVATLRTERAGPCDVALSGNAPPALV